jgi:hypothetical protein
VLDGIPIGYHVVYAGKESRGYPELLGSFYLNEDEAQIALVKDNSTTRINIELGDALGRIRGSVKDFRSKKPINTAYIKLSIARDPGRSLTTSIEDDGTFLVVVQPEAVNIQVLAEGYQVHQVEGTVRTLDMIQVRRGAVVEVRIKLRMLGLARN